MIPRALLAMALVGAGVMLALAVVAIVVDIRSGQLLAVRAYLLVMPQSVGVIAMAYLVWRDCR